MDEDTFNAIRALHDAFTLQYAVSDDGGSQQHEEHLTSLESTYAYAAVNHFVDAGGEYSTQEKQNYPSIGSSSNRGASSSSYNENDNDITYRIGESSSSGISRQRLDVTTQHSSLIAAILIMVVYPLIVTRLRPRWWMNMNRKTKLMPSEDLKEKGGAISYSCVQDNMMLERGFTDDVV